MPTALRPALTFFSFVLLGQLAFLWGSQGLAALTPLALLLATGISAAITLIWDFAIQRSVRRGLARLERRINRLSAKPRGIDEAIAPSGDEAIHCLERRLMARQKRIADYTRRLRHELARFRAIYRHSHDAVMIFEPGDGRLVDCNPRAAEFLGMEQDALKGLRLFELHDEDEPYLRSLIDDVMDSDNRQVAL